MKTAALFLAASSLAAAVLAAPARLQTRADQVTYDDYTENDGSGTEDLQYAPYNDPDHKWVHLKNQGNTYYNGTESFIQYGGASYSFAYFDGPSMKIYASKKKDRGFFDIFYAGDHVGVGDAWGTCEGDYCPSEVVFSTDKLPTSTGDVTVIVKARESDYRVEGVPFFAIDKVVLN
ncbi:hypothetical protein JCM10207_009261 [Rhodosporidiobolus poonsookiae]